MFAFLCINNFNWPIILCTTISKNIKKCVVYVICIFEFTFAGTFFDLPPELKYGH